MNDAKLRQILLERRSHVHGNRLVAGKKLPIGLVSEWHITDLDLVALKIRIHDLTP